MQYGNLSPEILHDAILPWGSPTYPALPSLARSSARANLTDPTPSAFVSRNFLMPGVSELQHRGYEDSLKRNYNLVARGATTTDRQMDHRPATSHHPICYHLIHLCGLSSTLSLPNTAAKTPRKVKLSVYPIRTIQTASMSSSGFFAPNRTFQENACTKP